MFNKFSVKKFCLGGIALVCPALITSVGSLPAIAQASVKGHIVEYEGPSRLQRPKNMETTRTHVDKRGLSLSAGTTGNVLAPSKFKFGAVKSNPAADLLPPRREREEPTALSARTREESEELTVAWDEWHKRVIAAMYTRWKNMRDFSGQARVTIIVNRDGDMDFSLSDFESGDSRHYNPGAEDSFKNAVRHVLNAVAKTPVLEFPGMSQRQEVQLVTTFSMNMDTPSGYTYKQGDYERVRLPVGK